MKKNLKKLFALLLVVVMVAAIFAGCAGNTEKPAETTTPSDTTETTTTEETTPTEDVAPAETRENKVIYGSSTEISGDLGNAWWTNNASDKTIRDLINDYDTVIFDQFGQMVMNATTAASIDEAKNDVRVVLHLHPALAPFKCAVLPLSKKLGDKAMEIRNELAKDFMVDYDDAGSIGKRYRRQDEIGTPLCITVDFQTVGDDKVEADGCVTVRDRDTMEQVRMPISELRDYVAKKVAF